MSNYCNCNAPKKIGSKTNPPKFHEDEKVLVKNACSSQIANPLTLAANTPLEIASINLDLDKFKRAAVLIQISGQLANPGLVAVVSSFRLVRTCNGARQVISQNSVIDQSGTATTFADINFKFCDCSPCCDCAVYSIEYISDVLLSPTGTVISINNVCLQAIVTEAGPCTCNCCCC